MDIKTDLSRKTICMTKAMESTSNQDVLIESKPDRDMEYSVSEYYPGALVNTAMTIDDYLERLK
jgi:hypothetical protein